MRYAFHGSLERSILCFSAEEFYKKCSRKATLEVFGESAHPVFNLEKKPMLS